MPKETRATLASRRRTPYTRPSRKPEEPAGIWSRIKQFFWGQQPTTELGPPQSLSASDDSNATRITHSSAENSFDPSSVDVSQVSITSDFPSLQNTSHISQLVDSGELGPNEALEQFFAEKGEAELTNDEVADALTLISKAVSRNESLLDFSNLSETSQISYEPTETSISRNINAPPSPHVFTRATPPSITRSRSSIAVSQSPWTSPHPYLRPRRSFYQNVSLGGQSPRQPVSKPRPSRGSKPMRSSLVADSKISESDSTPTNKASFTPAASAILKASNGPEKASSPKPDTTITRRNRYIRESVSNPPLPTSLSGDSAIKPSHNPSQQESFLKSNISGISADGQMKSQTSSQINDTQSNNKLKTTTGSNGKGSSDKETNKMNEETTNANGHEGKKDNIFTFGSKKNDAGSAQKAAATDKPPFGQLPSQGQNTDKPAFSFSAPPKTDKPGFTFNAASKTEKPAFTADAAPKTDKPAFTFNAAPKTDKPTFSFGNAQNNEKPAFSFNSVPNTEKTEKPAFSFNAAPSTEKPAVSFNSASSTDKPAFSFNAAPKPAEPSASTSTVASTFAQPQSSSVAKPPSTGAYENKFEFEIPTSNTPREMTPAEEAIVAQTQNEFTF